MVATGALAVESRSVGFFYGSHQVLNNINLSIPTNQVTTLIGPSGCGKSTFLRSLNRMNDRISGARLTGAVWVDGENIYARGVDLMQLRRKVGMVFQKPNPFPSSIFENIALAPRLHYGISGKVLEEFVEEALRHAALWDEVKDSLDKSALALSGGQQQRLCIARTLAVQPEIILMDEPCSALDPLSTYHIESLIRNLAAELTLVVVTHNLHQAGRVSDNTAFFLQGEVVEYGRTEDIFTRPREKATEDYVSGRFG